MNTTHTVQGTIDNAMNITEAISMLTSRYKVIYRLNIENVKCRSGHTWINIYDFTLEHKEEFDV